MIGDGSLDGFQPNPLYEVIRMMERYEHEGKSLNMLIIRDILGCSIGLVSKLPQTSEWLSVDDVLDRITQYHLQNGGEPHRLKDPYTQVGDVLRELARWGRAEVRVVEGNKHYYRFIPSP